MPMIPMIIVGFVAGLFAMCIIDLYRRVFEMRGND